MRKTSVYLDEAESTRLAALALAEGRSQAEIIRDAIAAYSPRRPGGRRFALDGAGEPGDGGSLAEIDEAVLLEGFGG